MKRSLVLALVLLAGCGQGAATGGQASPSASHGAGSPAASSSAATVLFAVSEGTDQACGSGCQGRLAIVGLDGRVRARTTFNPPKAAVVGCEGGYVTNPVQVAAGAVYYMDDTGVVRRLGATGAIREVPAFPSGPASSCCGWRSAPTGRV